MYLPPFTPWFGPVFMACIAPWPTVQKNSLAELPADLLQHAEIVPSRLGQVPAVQAEDWKGSETGAFKVTQVVVADTGVLHALTLVGPQVSFT